MVLTQSSTSQFVRIGQGEPSGSTVSQLKLRLFSLSTTFSNRNKYPSKKGFNLKLRLFSLSTATYGGYTIFQVKKVPYRVYLTI